MGGRSLDHYIWVQTHELLLCIAKKYDQVFATIFEWYTKNSLAIRRRGSIGYLLAVKSKVLV